MTDAELAEFLTIVAGVKQDVALSQWERQFLLDLEAKYERSKQDGTEMTLTPRQWDALRRIEDKT